jgi:hypothetical protein
MNNLEILKELLNDSELKINWSRVDIAKVNLTNLSSIERSNMYLATLKLLLDDSWNTKTQIRNNILEIIA